MAELQDLSNILGALAENLNLVIANLKDGESSREARDDFTLQSFWTDIVVAVKAIAGEATKLCLAFLEPPYLSAAECQPLISGIEKATLATVSVFYGLPKTQGLTLRRMVREAVLNLVQAVHRLVTSISADGLQGLQEQRQSTGSVWHHCDHFPNLPKDNCAAVQMICQQQQALVTDAVKEIEEVQQDGGDNCWADLNDLLGEEDDQHDNQNTFSEADKELLGPAIGLMKACRSCLKKLNGALTKNGRVESEECRLQLDDLADRLSIVSLTVDELASCLYPPITHQVVQQHGEKLCLLLNGLLQYARYSHITVEEDSQWVDFLLKAVEHNQQKMIDIIQKNS